MNGVTPEWSAPTVIANTRGIDVVLDGHSHEVFAGEGYKNADGKEILYTQTGTKLMYIGRLNISKDGALRSELIRPADVDVNKSESVKKAYDDVKKLIEADNAKLAFLNEKIGTADVALTDTDPRTGTRRVRSGETNLGDFWCDAVLWGAEKSSGTKPSDCSTYSPDSDWCRCSPRTFFATSLCAS